MHTTFDGQHTGEEVILWIEKHWIKYARIISIIFMAGFLPGALLVLAVRTFFSSSSDLTLAFVLLYELFVLLYAFIELVNDELDFFIITNERIVDITQVSLLERRIADTPLENVQDVAAEVKGFLPTVFNFGKITVQTAGTSANFTMDMVSDPFTKSKQIIDLLKIHQKLDNP